MPNVSGAGTLWNLPNYLGLLFTKGQVNTPFTDQIADAAVTNSSEFAMGSFASPETPAQPAITETASLTAPTPVSYVRSNETNCAQIYQEKVSVSYQKLSNAGRVTFVESGTSGFGYSTGGENPVGDELNYQRAMQMQKIRLDMEYTFLNGVYQAATSAGVAWKSRGIITACASANTVDASSKALDGKLLDSLLKTMADAGTPFATGRHVIFVNAFQKQALTKKFSYVPNDRNIGGANIKMIETDFNQMEVVYSTLVPAGTLLIADMNRVKVVIQPVGQKPTIENGMLWEALAKTGAGEDWQLYLQAGLDYTSSFYHGTITNLATA